MMSIDLEKYERGEGMGVGSHAVMHRAAKKV